MAASAGDYRLAMRQLAAAVNVITAASDGERGGLTATAAMSLTADPPQLGIAVNKSASAFPLLAAGRRFALNVLAYDQVEIAGRFAGQDGCKGEARFAGAEWTTLATGAPTLAGAAAVFDCSVVREVDLGTHLLFVGRVEAVAVQPSSRPLLYLDGEWASLVRASSADVSRYLEAVDLSLGTVTSASRREGEPAERLRAFVQDFARVNIQVSDITRDFMTREHYVRPAELARINERKSEFDEELKALLDDGVGRGAFALEDTRLAALAISGMIGWTHRWYRDEGRLSPDEVAAGLARLVANMVARPPAPAAATDPGRPGAQPSS